MPAHLAGCGKRKDNHTMTVIQELEAALAQIASIQAEVAKRDELVAKAQDELVAAHDAHKAALEARDKVVAEMTERLAAADGALKAMQAERDAVIVERDEARKALKNPAFATAAVRGDASPVPEGDAPAPGEPKPSLVEQARAIKDPVERALFVQKNREAIRAEAGL